MPHHQQKDIMAYLYTKIIETVQRLVKLLHLICIEINSNIAFKHYTEESHHTPYEVHVISHSTSTRVGTLIVATIYLQLIQNRYMF